MQGIIESDKSTHVTIVVAWWEHLLDCVNGDILLVGNYRGSEVEYLSKLCDNLFVLNNKNSFSDEAGNISILSHDDVKDQSFNSIIIDNYSTDNEVTDEFIVKLSSENLSSKGKLCLFENNCLGLGDGSSGIFNAVSNLLNNNRQKLFNKLFSGSEIIKFPTITYDKTPYESFIEGGYSSNKNAFQVKEKIRSWLFNTVLSRIFVNSYIWVVSKDKSTTFFHHQILKYICNEFGLDESLYKLTKILYKSEKLIFSFKNEVDPDKSLVVMFLYGAKSISQRVNERKIIDYLKSYDELKGYLPDNYKESDYLGYKLFSMYECQGVTVDVASRHTDLMTENTFKVLIKLALITQNTYLLTPVIAPWVEKLKMRAPDRVNEINIIDDYIFNYKFEKSVCMHGDAKLENFVLSTNFNVVGIIDWEQGLLKGLPLIDLYYLIVYNYQTKHSCDFSDAFRVLAEGLISGSENTMLSAYCNDLFLTKSDRDFLLVVFFVHHYTCRFHADANDEVDYGGFEKALAIVMKMIGGLG
jgi:Phosphotransferase enzyme family